MPRSLLPWEQSPNLPTSRLTDGARQCRLTQSAAVHLFLRQLPLQVGAEEQERVVVHGFPQLARKMGQSGKVQGMGKGTRSGALSLPRSKENKVMVSFPSDKGIPRDQREGGRGREEDQSGGKARERRVQKTGKKELTPTKARAQTACLPPKTGHTPRKV